MFAPPDWAARCFRAEKLSRLQWLAQAYDGGVAGGEGAGGTVKPEVRQRLVAGLCE